MTTALTKTRRKRTISEINVLLNKPFVEEDIIKANLLVESLQEYRKVITEYNDKLVI